MDAARYFIFYFLFFHIYRQVQFQSQPPDWQRVSPSESPLLSSSPSESLPHVYRTPWLSVWASAVVGISGGHCGNGGGSVHPISSLPFNCEYADSNFWNCNVLPLRLSGWYTRASLRYARRVLLWDIGRLSFKIPIHQSTLTFIYLFM